MKKNTVRAALILAAAVLIGSGVLNGGMRDTFAKGVMICLECVGIG